MSTSINDIRKQKIFNKTLHSSIDRIKVSFEIKNKTTKGNKYALIPDNFTSLPNVVKNRPLERGIYHVFESEDFEKCLQHCWTVPLKTSDFEIENIIKQLKAPQRKLQRNNKIYYYKGYTKVLVHYEYRILGWNQKARIIKNKNYLIIELNDVLQDNPNTSPYKLIKDAVEFLIKIGLIQLNTEVKNKKSVKSKAYRVMKQAKISEIEVAFDFNSHFSKIFYQQLKQSTHDNLSFINYKDTIYWNNSYLKRRDWKYKLYNRSLKDRVDLYINGLDKILLKQSFSHLLSYVPTEVKTNKQEDDIYRFEITIGRDRLKKYDDRELLKLHSNLMIPLLKDDISPAITKFFDRIAYPDVKEFINSLKKELLADNQKEYNNITKKNYKKQLKQILPLS